MALARSGARNRTAVALVALTIIQAVNLAFVADADARKLVSDIVQAVAAIVAAAVLLAASRKLRVEESHAADGWTVIGWAACLFAAGQVSFMFVEIVLKRPPYPGIPDVFFIGFYPLAIAGLMRLPWRRSNRRQMWNGAIDLAAFALPAAAVVWHFNLRVLLAKLPGGAPGGAAAIEVSLAYTVLDSGFLMFLFFLTARRLEQGVQFVPLMLLMASDFFLILADLLQGYAAAFTVFASGSPIDMGWVLFSALAGLAGIYLLSHGDASSIEPAAVLRIDVLRALWAIGITYSWIAIGISALIWAIFNRDVANPALLAAGVGGAVVAAGARQLRSIREIADLSEQLRQASEEMENKVHERTAELETERTFADAVMDSVPGLLYLYDTSGRLVRWNKQHEAITGYSDADIADMHILDWLGGHEPDTSRIVQAVKAVHEEGYAAVEARIVTKDGRRIPFYLTGVRLTIGGKEYLTGIGIDMTKHREAEEALRQSEEKFARAFMASPDAMAIIRPVTGELLEINEACERMFGYSSAETAGKSTIELGAWIEPGDRAMLLREIRDTGRARDYEVLLRNRSGKVITALMWAEVISVGEERLLLASARDITSRKQDEEALRERTGELEALNTLAKTVNQSLSPAQVAQPAAQTIQEVTGCDLALLFMRDGDRLTLSGIYPDSCPDMRSPEIVHGIGRCLCGMAAESGQAIISRDIRQDPRCTMTECRDAGFVSFAALPLKVDGTPAAVIGLGMRTEYDFAKRSAFLEAMANLTATALGNALLHEQVRLHAQDLELRVSERTAELQAANQELEAFAYSVSHDLRAPLRSIDGFSQMLQQDFEALLADEGRDLIARIRGGAGRMAQLIDDMLKLARLSHIELRRTQVDLTAMAGEIAAELQASEPHRKVEFVAASGIAGRCDKVLMRVVLENLIGNAWKFTGRRSDARIEFGRVQEDGRDAFFVRDNGIGFDMQYADKLFGAFQRMHNDAEFEGSGVGLATVRRIVQRHGGEVWAVGEVDQGATFTFTLAELHQPARSGRG